MQSTYDKGCDELLDESGAIDICAHCAAESKLQPGLYFCLQCGPFGRYICGDCNKQHKKFLNGHKIRDVSAAVKQPRGNSNVQEDEIQQAKQQLEYLVREIETRKEVPDKVTPDGELAINIVEARKKLSKDRAFYSKLEHEMKQAKRQLKRLFEEIEAQKEFTDKVIPDGVLARNIFEARKKLSKDRTSTSQLEHEMNQAKRQLKSLFEEIEAQKEFTDKVIPDGELARNIFEARKKLSKDRTSNTQLEEEMQQAKQQLDFLMKELESRKDVTDKVKLVGELAVNINEARKKLSQDRSSNSKQEDEIQQAKQQLECLVKEIETRREVLDKVIPDGELARNIYEARKKLNTDRNSNSKLEDEMKQAKQQLELLDKVITDEKWARNNYEAIKKLSKDRNSTSKYNEGNRVVDYLKEEKTQLMNRYNEVNLVVACFEMEKMEITQLMNKYNRLSIAYPLIADLSDPNRPTKLADKFSEMFDNEWTDAYEGLYTKNMKEKDAIQFLINILSESYQECADISRQQMILVKELIEHTDPDEKSRGKGSTDVKLTELQTMVLTKLRKKRAYKYVQSLQSYFKEKYRNDTHRQRWFYEDNLKPFTMRCIELCWLMQVHSPPVHLELEVKSGEKFDTNKYKAYTNKGNKIDFVVWPPMLLNEGGPLLLKGVAQGQ